MEFLTQLKQKKILIIVAGIILFLLILILSLSGKSSPISPTPPALP